MFHIGTHFISVRKYLIRKQYSTDQKFRKLSALFFIPKKVGKLIPAVDGRRPKLVRVS